jgi:hypothetical protein
MSIADDVKENLATGLLPGHVRLSVSQLCDLYDEEHPDSVETGTESESIAFTYSDGSVLIIDTNEGIKVNNENVDPEDDQPE